MIFCCSTVRVGVKRTDDPDKLTQAFASNFKLDFTQTIKLRHQIHNIFHRLGPLPDENTLVPSSSTSNPSSKLKEGNPVTSKQEINNGAKIPVKTVTKTPSKTATSTPQKR